MTSAPKFSVGDKVSLKNNRLVPYWVVDQVTEYEPVVKYLVISLDSDAKQRVCSEHNMYLMEKGDNW